MNSVDADAAPTPRRLLRVHEAAGALAISEAMCWSLIKTGRLRSIKIHTARRVPIEALDEFVDQAVA
ncbi:helix-turn-helix domain-containing protein [Spiractinospora alimapuensis]|uniref:helix-turn-helix domain-containing protein n=1 Tax=Spiractinospora alimapuensis TaxID=2820884 RepID=UPI001F292F10|nr:helix-turn-helix domain-containing protein [Spiractinospora alimapuensis]QVQ51329.1 helix-turn-helix domain-containing protein [Spiractinospora alimapuensis]